MNQSLISLTDKELITLFKNGNSNAFGILVQRHTQIMSITLLKILKDPMLVEDVMQDTFIKAMEALQRKDKEGYTESGTFRAWIINIGHNLAIDYFRKSKTRNTVNVPTIDGVEHFSPLVDHQNSVEDDIINSEVDYDIQVLMDKLDPEQREVINLRHFHGFSFKEITEYIGGGISINTCLGRMRYGLINLRKMINEVKSVGQKIL